MFVSVSLIHLHSFYNFRSLNNVIKYIINTHREESEGIEDMEIVQQLQGIVQGGNKTH